MRRPTCITEVIEKFSEAKKQLIVTIAKELYIDKILDFIVDLPKTKRNK